MTAPTQRWLNQVGIGWRLGAGAALPVLLFVAFSMWLWSGLSQVRGSLTASEQGVDYALLAKDMQRNVVQVQQFLSDVSATRGLDNLDDGFEDAQKNRAEFLAALGRFKTYLSQQGQSENARLLDTIQVQFDQYYQDGVRMAQAYVKGGPPLGNPLMTPFDKSSSALQTSLNKFVDGQVQTMQARSGDIAKLTERLRWVALLLCAACAILVVGLSLVLARSILRPLRRASEVVHRVAQGDLSTPLQVSGKDEVAKLLLDLKAMQQKLLEIFKHLHDNAHHVDTASAEIALGNSDMAERTEQQAHALVEITAAVQQIETTVQNNVNHVQQANQLAVETERVAEQGGSVVQEFVSTMKGINDSSHRIGDIISVIDSIAFQTNILALNAAVEAARAGEQGRGFAVVASEVRTLAQRSAAAAREIKTLVTESVARVEQGTRLVDHAGTTMSNVLEAVNKMTNLMRELDTSAATQITGVSQVALAVTQMEQGTQQNAALAEQSARAADGLKQQSSDMVQAMSVFRLARAEA